MDEKEKITNANVKTVGEVAEKVLGKLKDDKAKCEGIIALVMSTNEKGETRFILSKETTLMTEYEVLSTGILAKIETTIATTLLKGMAEILTNGTEEEKKNAKEDFKLMCETIKANNPRVASLMPENKPLSDKSVN